MDGSIERESFLWRYIYDKIQYSVVEIESSKSGMHQSEVTWQQADSANTHNAKGQNARRQNPKRHYAMCSFCRADAYGG